MTDPTKTSAWSALQQHARESSATISELFARDANRAADFSAEGAGIFLDYSKQRLDAQARGLLLELAQQQGMADAIRRMFAGEAINQTEQRAALHVALRGSGPQRAQHE
ncbi:MAG TPA: hypothetical protein VHE37_07370, partial [Nevskiaceae bacterium]|nr:hypothetical protein [Nevskiaceae bacterium]